MSDNNTPLTQAEAQRAALGIAAAQTAYALNNGGGIVPGQPLTYIDDATTAGRPGYTPLHVNIPGATVVHERGSVARKRNGSRSPALPVSNRPTRSSLGIQRPVWVAAGHGSI